MPACEDAMTAVSLPFRTLLYRYFFYGWLFRDAMRGNSWERSAAWRHNREQARWLPTYLKRWAVLMTVLLPAAHVVEVGLRAPALSALLYVPPVCMVSFLAVTAVCWFFLTRPDQH
jgi:hypothetical protein